MFEVWDHQKISELTNMEIDQWFDVLNYRLEEDRHLSPQDPSFTEKQTQIRLDYVDYIRSCATSKDIHKYYIFKRDDMIVSVCRVNIRDNHYVLEGLQTHHRYYRQGLAESLLLSMFEDLRRDGIQTLFSEARVWNEASNQLQRKVGFIQYGIEEPNYLYRIDLA